MANRLISLICIAVLVSFAHGAVPAVTSNNSGTVVNAAFSLGYVFTVNQNQELTALGQFDVAGNGAVATAKVALFNWSTGAKLVETTLAGAVLEETGVYDTHFKSLPTAIALTPGTQYLIAVEAAPNDFVYDSAKQGMMTLNSAVDWIAGRATALGSPAMPTTATSATFSIVRTAEVNGSYFGPNMKLLSNPTSPVSDVSIVSPASRLIVQRTSTDTGDIPLAGRCSSTADAVEARAVVMPGSGNSGSSTAWQVVDASPVAGNFSGTLRHVPAGGWYQLEMRSVTNGSPGLTAVREKVGVGDIYVTAGQSNSANYGDGGYVVSDDRVCARTAVTGSQWILAADPIPIAGGSGGCVWTRLGDMLAAADHIPVGFISVGVGSTQVGQWVPGTANYENLLKPAIQSFPVNGFRAVLWHQGESDSIAAVSAATYASRLTSIIAQSRLDAGWSIPWYVAEASFHPTPTLSLEEPVAAGQRAAVHADPLVFLGPSTDEFHLEDASGGKLRDAVHFNNVGLRAHAAQWRDLLRGTTALAPRNGHFEDNRTLSITNLGPLADGAVHLVTTTTNTDSPSVLGWRILSASGTAAAEGAHGFHNPAAGSFVHAADSNNGGVLPNMAGRHVAMLNGGSAGDYFLHSTRALAQASTYYTLRASVGVRDQPLSYGNLRLELTANGVVVAAKTFTKAMLDTMRGGDSAGTFTAVSVHWTTGQTIAPNQPLAIRVVKEGGPGTVVDFDRVELTSSPTVDYETWIGNPAFRIGVTDRDFDDDPDGDLLPNGIEAWFGTDPGTCNPGLAAAAFQVSSMSFTHPQNPTAPVGLSGFYQWSPNLVDWSTSGDGAAGGASVTLSPTTLGNLTTVQAVASEPMPQLFFRVAVRRN